MRNIFLFIFIFFISVFSAYTQESESFLKIKDTCKIFEKTFLSPYRDITSKNYVRYVRYEDYANIKSILPEIEKAAQILYNAELPQIAKEKKDKWDKHINSIKRLIVKYKTAIKENEDGKLLEISNSLRNLSFKIAFTFRPARPEFMEFHTLLYYIENHCLAENKQQELKNLASNIMRAKNNLVSWPFSYEWNIVEASPEDKEARRNIFNKEKIRLSEKTDELIESIKNYNHENILKLFCTVHEIYHVCEDQMNPE